jgi:alpha-amylase/alpha-mannosidase (GH57 family)
MHQPWFVDPSGEGPQLPWVRLHGASTYRDMATLLAAHPGVRVNVCLSPSLLEQLQLYLAGTRDSYEQLTLTPADQLTSEQRSILLQYFFSVHWPRVMPALPGYQRLLEKRGQEPPAEAELAQACGFTDDELRDLQLLFNLAWLGPDAGDDPAIARLSRQGVGFSEEDKLLVLEHQRRLLREVVPAWRGLAETGAVEVCGTAFHHGILPLLGDSNIARRASPEAWLPERFSHPEDSRVQIERALTQIEQTLGVRPRGIWPPEGAVSPETVRLASSCELDYVVTDGTLLFHSLDDRGSTPGRNRLSQAYRFGDAALFFRDNELSELISTEYPRWDDSAAAAADLLQRVRELGAAAHVDGDAPPVVVITADENPWEAYPNRGLDFLGALYEQICSSDEIRTVTLSEHLAEHPPTVALDYLHSGSRIESNFAVWIGDPEKNRAWDLLGRARGRLERAQRDPTADPSTLEQARDHLLRAESSDWFWWLGEPFSSAEDPIYDALFRGHIIGMYRTLGDSPPADLSRPIAQGGIVKPLRQPTAYIHPQIRGKRTSFFEWRSAGFYRVPTGGSLYQEHSIISGLYWGFDVGRFFLRLDPVESQRGGTALRPDSLSIWFELTAPDRQVTARLTLDQPPHLSLSVQRNGGARDLGQVEEIAYKEVIELAIPLSRLDLAPGTRVGLSVHFARGEEELAKVPFKGVVEVEIPGDEFGE